jgi:hypothetical protein
VSNKIKAVVDVDARYFDDAHLYELFNVHPARPQYVFCSVAVTKYSLGDPSFVQITFDTETKGEITLFIPRAHVLLIEESERFSEEPPPRIGFREPVKQAGTR